MWGARAPVKVLISVVIARLITVSLGDFSSDLFSYVVLLVVLCDIYVVLLMMCLTSHIQKERLFLLALLLGFLLLGRRALGAVLEGRRGLLSG